MLLQEFPHYSISTCGTISRNSDGFIKKHTKAINGYMVVMFHHKGKVYRRYVHRLIAQTFLPSPAEKMEVNHKDLDRANNRLENLEWVTSSENKRHALRNGGGKKVKEEQMLTILTYIEAGYSESQTKRITTTYNWLIWRAKNYYGYPT